MALILLALCCATAGIGPKALRGQAEAKLQQLQSNIVEKGEHVSCARLVKELCLRWGRLPDQALQLMGLKDWLQLPYLAQFRVRGLKG